MFLANSKLKPLPEAKAFCAQEKSLGSPRRTTVAEALSRETRALLNTFSFQRYLSRVQFL